MADDPKLTPGAWLEFLCGKLDHQVEMIQQYTDYYNGEHKLSFATAKFREAFSRYFPPMSNNWMKLVCEAPISRLVVTGFRMNPDTAKADWNQESDDEAWAIWQANSMDAISRQVMLEAVKSSIAHVMISPPSEDNYNKPLLTAELPSQVYVYCSPQNKRRRLAAIKRWVDEIDGLAYANLYFPNEIRKYVSTAKYKEGMKIQWTNRSDDPGGPNPIGVVPIVPVENIPDIACGGRSDLEAAIPLQDAVNKLCLDMQVSSEYHAFPQRWATGWESAKKPDGTPIKDREAEVAVGQSRLVRAESPETKFGQWAPGEVDNYIKPIELYIEHLAAITQTPTYYLKGKMANMSADALHAADAGLVDRCNAKIVGGFSDAWEEVIRTAFLAADDQVRGKAFNAEAIWADPETKSLAQVTDAAVKWRTSLSLPLEMCWQLLGLSPQEIAMCKEMMGLPDSPAEWKAAILANEAEPVDPRGLGTSPMIPQEPVDPKTGQQPAKAAANVGSTAR